MAQDYKNVAKIIDRNVNYIVLFKNNDNISINNIIRNHNITNIDKDLFKKAYMLCTDVPFQFMLFDLELMMRKKELEAIFKIFSIQDQEMKNYSSSKKKTSNDNK